MAPELEDGRGISCDEARWECTLDYQECCEELNDMGFKVRISCFFYGRWVADFHLPSMSSYLRIQETSCAGTPQPVL